MIKLFRYLKPYILPIVAVFVLVIGQVFCELAMPKVMSSVVDQGIMRGDYQYILIQCGIMLGFAVLAACCVITSNYLSSRVSMSFGAKVRSKLFEKVQSFSVSEMDRVGTSSLVTRTTNDVVQVQSFVYVMLRMLILAPLMFIGGIVFAVGEDVKLTMVLLVSIPVIIILIALVSFKVMPLFKSMQKKVDALTVVTRENLTGVRVIRAFNQEARESKRFDVANRDVANTAIKGNRWMSLLMPAIMLVMNLTTVAVVWVGAANMTGEATLGVGSVMAVLQYVMQIMMGLVTVAMVFVMIPRASASAQRINEVLAIRPVIEDAADSRNAESGRGLLEFENVSFSYEGAGERALSDISFVSRPGETTAIIGSTGSGKSTLINLIPRFFDPDADGGRILLNGQDIREIPVETLRKKIGFVPQKALLFSGTVAGNIRYGKPDATDEEVKKAAEIAQAASFIEGLEKGYDSPVAQGGTNFSGGQKQRLAIARALVRRPEVYVFDDSFSALDYKTDKALRAALRDETRDATVLIVAQRVSTIMDADRILVLDEGKIVGEGTHRELLAGNPVYQEIVLSQMEKEEA